MKAQPTTNEPVGEWTRLQRIQGRWRRARLHLMGLSWWTNPPVSDTVLLVAFLVAILLVPLDLRLLGSEWRMFTLVDFSAITREFFFWAFPITAAANGFLVERLLRRRFDPPAGAMRLLRVAVSCLPLGGLLVLTAWQARSHRGGASAIASTTPDGQQTAEPGGGAESSGRREAAYSRWSGAAVLHRLEGSPLWLGWVLAWNFLLLLVLVNWLTAPTGMSRIWRLTIAGLAMLLHGLSFSTRWLYLSRQARELGLSAPRQRGYKWLALLALFPEPAGLVAFSAALHFERRGRSRTLLHSAFSAGHGVRSLPRFDGLVEAMRRLSNAGPWWLRERERLKWSPLPAVGNVERRFLRICRLKLWWVAIDAAVFAWCLVWLPQRGSWAPVLSAASLWLSMVTTGLTLMGMTLLIVLEMVRSPLRGLGRLCNEERPSWQLAAWIALLLLAAGLTLGALGTIAYLPLSLNLPGVIWLPLVGSILCLILLGGELRAARSGVLRVEGLPLREGILVLLLFTTVVAPLGGLSVPVWLAARPQRWREALGRGAH